MKRIGEELKRLQTILDLETRALDKAVCALGKVRMYYREQEDKLHELERYCREYQEQLTVLSSGGIQVAKVNGYRHFVGRLSGVIAQQKLNLSQTVSEVKAREQDWKKARARKDGIEKLLDMRRQSLRAHKRKEEQRQMDDHRSPGYWLEMPNHRHDTHDDQPDKDAEWNSQP